MPALLWLTRHLLADREAEQRRTMREQDERVRQALDEARAKARLYPQPELEARAAVIEFPLDRRT